MVKIKKYPFFKKCLFIHERHTEREKQRHKQREEQAPCREPDVGLQPGTPGTHPEWKEGRHSTAEPPRDPQDEKYPKLHEILKLLCIVSCIISLIFDG